MGIDVYKRQYLDDATMAGLKEVTIIHGRGEGILRKGLQEDVYKRQLQEISLYW